MESFTELATYLNPLLAREGVELHFEGYIETWQAYLRCQETLLDEMFVLMKETLAWANYFSEVLAWMNWRYLTEENRETYFKAHYEQTPVTDREFKKIQQCYEESAWLKQKIKLFIKHLQTQMRAFYRAYHQLKEMYWLQMEKASPSLLVADH